MGTTLFALPALERLLGEGHEIAAVYTQPPRPAGRGAHPRRTPMHDAAARLGLPVLTPATLKDPAVRAELAAIAPDLAVVGAYGLLLPRAVLEIPRLGCINLHASLLPRWRGAAPIERAVLAGDAETGVSIFAMEPGLDTGPVYATRAVPIGPRTTAEDLHEDLARLSAEMLPEVVRGIALGSLAPVPQPEEGVTYAAKLSADEGRLDFREPASLVERRLRALNPRPGCWCEVRGERLRILEGEVVEGNGAPGTILAAPLVVACGEGALRVTRAQRAGRRPVDAAELRRGLRLEPGSPVG